MKKSSITILSLITLLLTSIVTSYSAEKIIPLKVGSSAPDFTLSGIDGKDHSLVDYAKADILAILFTCNHCPSAQAVESRVKKMVDDYKGQSFQLVAISPNHAESLRLNELGYSVYGDTLDEMKKHAAEQKFNFPYLFDGKTQTVARAYGALATPHVFIFDKSRQLQYVGRIDDSRYGDPSLVKSHDARNAIDALLAGKKPSVTQTRAHGCSTKWAHNQNLVEQYNQEFEKKTVLLEKIDAAGIKKLVANPTNKLRLINLWATWCPPCVAEFPELVKIGRQFETRGFDFISISLDSPDMKQEVLEFLTSEHAALPRLTEKSLIKEGRKSNNYLYSNSDTDALAEALDPQWQGPIPYSILVAPGGKILFRQTGEIDPVELKTEILNHLGRFYSPPNKPASPTNSNKAP
ncbi:MAG: redoxin domain-containing protein [Verrucomicrobiales bacterium]|nr:redoxin domain-containing protein [Verrucomicrobiales bacterium]